MNASPIQHMGARCGIGAFAGFLVLLPLACGQTTETSGKAPTITGLKSSAAIASRVDLSELLQKGMNESEVIEALDVKAASIGPSINIHEKHIRYRTALFPRKVVEVMYFRTASAELAEEWKLTDAEDYDWFLPIGDFKKALKSTAIAETESKSEVP